MKIHFFTLIFLLVIFFSSIKAQSNFSTGFNLGGGTIGGSSPSQGSYFTSIFIDFETPFLAGTSTRINFLYSQDFNAIVPESRDRYYSFIKGFTLRLFTSQLFIDNFYLEEGTGLAFLNDRTFNDIDSWNYGIIFSLLGGLDFRNENPNGIRLAVGTDYAFSFSNTFARYFALYAQLQYMF